MTGFNPPRETSPEGSFPASPFSRPQVLTSRPNSRRPAAVVRRAACDSTRKFLFRL